MNKTTIPKGKNWKPIKTAPRDVTVIDIWHHDYRIIKDCWFDDGVLVGCPEGCVTHWRHIPKDRIRRQLATIL